MSPDTRTARKLLLAQRDEMAERHYALGGHHAHNGALHCQCELAAEYRSLLKRIEFDEAKHAPSEPSAREKELLSVIDRARRITASDPDNVWCRQATIVLDGAITGNAQGE